MKVVFPNMTNEKKGSTEGLSNLPKDILQINGRAETEPRALRFLARMLLS